MIIKLCLNDVYITLYAHGIISMRHGSVSIFYKCSDIQYEIDMELYVAVENYFIPV